MHGDGCPSLYLKFTLGHNYLSTKPISKWETCPGLDVLSISWDPCGIALPGDPGRKCQSAEANFLNESLPGARPHSFITICSHLQAARQLSILWHVARMLLWEECSNLGGEKLTQCAEGPLLELPRRPESSLCRQLTRASRLEPSVVLSAGPCCESARS